MRYDRIEDRSYLNLLLERRMERAFNYAVRKGLSPVEHMRKNIDLLVGHIFRLIITNSADPKHC